MTDIKIGSLKTIFRKTFLQRLGGAITRPISDNEAMIFMPGGSVHTFFMRQSIDIVFVSKEWQVLKIRENISPWRLVFAPKGAKITIETMAFCTRRINLQQGDRLK